MRGTGIGRFIVLDSLGEGGMGVVQAAYDPDLDRKVALKLLRPHHGDSADLRARLVREAQAMAHHQDPEPRRQCSAALTRAAHPEPQAPRNASRWAGTLRL